MKNQNRITETTTTVTRRRRRGRCCYGLLRAPPILLSLLATAGILLLFCGGDLPRCDAQFNEPPGQRREQTFRVVEFEMSNINQHYPGDLRYYCTFRGKWSKERHPNDFPESASWSAPVIVSHSKDWRMWTGTETVTAGVEYMAEQGFPTILYNEFANAGYETLQMIIGDRMYNTSESQHLPPINVTYSHPWLSAMTKISPSPDWFVGFSDFRTISYDTETFYNRVVIQSYVWDAGTDEGQNYLSFDRDLDPQVPCMRMCVPPHVGQGGVGSYDANIVHVPGAQQIHHPTGNTKKCPDRAKGRVAVPRAGQFLDYSASYIPFPAEYECVLRVGDGEVYAGNAFNQSQIRPPKFVARPDDDFLDGISPYDQPAYDNHVAILNGEMEPEKEPWDRRWLWLVVVLLLCCVLPCTIAMACLLLSFLRRQKERAMNEETDELHLDMFVDEGFVDEEDGDYRDSTLGSRSHRDNIEDYDDGDDAMIGRSRGDLSAGTRDSYYGDDDIDTSYNTGVSAGDDYDSWLASQNVSQGVRYEDEDYDDGSSDDSDHDGGGKTGTNSKSRGGGSGRFGGDGVEDDDDNDGYGGDDNSTRSGDSRSDDDDDYQDGYGHAKPKSSASLKPPSMTSMGGTDRL